MPDCANDRDAAVMLPARLKPKVAASAECRGAEGLYGVTQWVKGFRTLIAVYKEDGTASGRVEMKGLMREGVEWCNDLKTKSVKGLSMYTIKNEDISPQYHASILCSSSSVLPCLSCEFAVDCAPLTPVHSRIRCG